MRLLPLVLAGLLTLALAPAASASYTSLERPHLPGYTPALHAQIIAAGPKGQMVGEEELNLWCPGVQTRGVQAGGCIVDPYGCTANFVFRDSSSFYIGTASHCVDGVGQEVVMQVDTVTLASIGTVAKRTAKQEPGEDFALIKIDPAVAAKWGVVPAMPTGGPQGIYTGCDVQVVRHWGHGYGVAVAQGKQEGGIATNWHDDGFGWTGVGAPGDSGSGVLLADGRAAGNFTHLIVDTRDYLGSDLAGTRITKMLQFARASLVNADGTTVSARGATSNCD